MTLTNLFYLVLLYVVAVAVEPLVRGLRKLPEDIDWSYSGMCFIDLEKFKKNITITGSTQCISVSL